MKVKVCDFGLARSTEKDRDQETFKKLRGTMAFLAPEVFTGTPHSFKSDIFSVGIVLWELMFVLMEGKYEAPYSEFGLHIDFQIIVQSSLGVRPNMPKGAPRMLVELYLRCVEKRPDDRPNALEVLECVNEMKKLYEADKENFIKDVYTDNLVFVKQDEINTGGSSTSTESKSSGFKGWSKKN